MEVLELELLDLVAVLPAITNVSLTVDLLAVQPDLLLSVGRPYRACQQSVRVNVGTF